MPKGRTGYEILKGLVKGQVKATPVEKQFFNPLDGRIGSHVRISNTEGFDTDLWTVTEIWVWDRVIDGNKHPMADYVLESDDKRAVLRVLPRVDRGKSVNPDVLLLSQYWPDDSGPYGWGDESPFILEGLMDPGGLFVKKDPDSGDVTETYYRDVSNAHAVVSIIKDANHDGAVDLDEIEREQYSLWTFRRTTTDESDQEFEQSLHVQVSGTYDPDNKKRPISDGAGSILILRGEVLSPMNFMMY
jgi:hypothetical protein